MNYSVVIRNKNEEKYIGYAIQSVVDFLGDKIQLVIVDNESSDESIRIVQTFDYLNISWLNISLSKCISFVSALSTPALLP